MGLLYNVDCMLKFPNRQKFVTYFRKQTLTLIFFCQIFIWYLSLSFFMVFFKLFFLIVRNVCNSRVLHHDRSVVLQDRPKIKKKYKNTRVRCLLVRSYECTSELITSVMHTLYGMV